MSSIVRNQVGVEVFDEDFVVEALAKELRPEWVREALRETGRESLRERLLPARFTLWLVILLGLFRRLSYANLLEKLDGSWWTLAHWPASGPPTSTAVTRARDRLGVEPLQHLWHTSAAAWGRATPGLIFHGRRVCALDGSTVKTPDSGENRACFGKPGASRGRAAYPQMRVALLVDVGPRLIRAEQHGVYRKGEMTLVRQLWPELRAGELYLMDRLFLAYDLLWDMRQRGADFLVRVPDKIKPRLVRQLGKGDALVEVTIPRPYRRHRRDMPRTWRLRMISYRTPGNREVIRLFTTLMDPKVKADELAALYHERWEVETVLDELKTHLCGCQTVNQAVLFRSRTPLRVEQEWYGLLIAYNAVRKTMGVAAATVHVAPCRLSFTAAVERTREAVYEMMRLPARDLATRYARALRQIARATVPERPHRKNPRAVKIKMSKFPLKRDAHAA